MPENRLVGLGVFDTAVGAQIRVVHTGMMRPEGATWLALSDPAGEAVTLRE